MDRIPPIASDEEAIKLLQKIEGEIAAVRRWFGHPPASHSIPHQPLRENSLISPIPAPPPSDPTTPLNPPIPEAPLENPEPLSIQDFSELARQSNGHLLPPPPSPTPTPDLSPMEMDFTRAVAEASYKPLTIGQADHEEIEVMSVDELEKGLVNSQIAENKKFFILEKLNYRMGRKSLDILARIIEDCREDQLLARVIQLIGHYGTTEHLELLKSYLHHPVTRIRATTVEALENIGDFDCIPFLIPLLTDPERRVQGNAAKALGRFGQNICLHAIEGLMTSPNPDNQKAALYAAKFVHLPEVREIFLQGLQSKNLEIQTRTIEILAELGQAEYREFIAKIEGHNPPPRLRAACREYFEAIK